MKFFAVYMKAEAQQPFETLVCVNSRFSFMAGIFQGFWALYHRVWWLAAMLIAIEVALGYIRSQEWLSAESVAVINLAMMAYVGFSASDWREADLKHKGYTLMDVVSARDEMEAQQRFLDQYLSRKTKIQQNAMHEALV